MQYSPPAPREARWRNLGSMEDPASRDPGDEPITGFCPLYHRAIEIIGRRWTGVIIRALLAGATRFSEIRTTVPGLSDRLLSERLKELEAQGIVERSVLPRTPVRIEYRLTPKGEALASVVAAASAWAEEWLAPQTASPA